MSRIPPVRCIECGMVLENLYEAYNLLCGMTAPVDGNINSFQIDPKSTTINTIPYEVLGITRQCCKVRLRTPLTAKDLEAIDYGFGYSSH